MLEAKKAAEKRRTALVPARPTAAATSAPQRSQSRKRGRMGRGAARAAAPRPSAGGAAPGVHLQSVLDVLLSIISNLGGSAAPDQTFMESGIDSLGAVQLRNEVTAAFGVELPPTVTFDYPTPTAMAAFIAGQVPSSNGAPVLEVTSAEPTAPDQAKQPAATSGPPLQRGAASLLPEVMDIVAGIVGAALGADDPLMASGLDSLGAVQLRNTISERFGVELPATAALDFPTPAVLSAFVAQGLDLPGDVAAGAAADTSGGMVFYSEDESEGAGVTELVGLSCIYPGKAADHNTGAAGFWSSAIMAEDLPSVVPHNRWDIESHYSADVAGQCVGWQAAASGGNKLKKKQ